MKSCGVIVTRGRGVAAFFPPRTFDQPRLHLTSHPTMTSRTERFQRKPLDPEEQEKGKVVGNEQDAAEEVIRFSVEEESVSNRVVHLEPC